MEVVLPKIILELSEKEARTLAFSLHEYIWLKAKEHREYHPGKDFNHFVRLYDPAEYDSSNNMFEMWGLLARFWKQEDSESFKKLIQEKLFTNDKATGEA